MKRYLFFFVMMQVLAFACVRGPFQETELVPLGPEAPQAIVERFQRSIPGNYQLLTTVVFEYNSRKFSGIGTLGIDNAGGLFTIACMNPMGVKLFELSGDRNSVKTLYTIADFSKYGDIGSAIGSDVRRIYFDLVPGPDAAVRIGKYKLRFRQPFGHGSLEFVFAGASGDLIEKNYYEETGIVWRASYYEYQVQDGQRWPGGIVFIHYNYGYRLTVKQKELRV